MVVMVVMDFSFQVNRLENCSDFSTVFNFVLQHRDRLTGRKRQTGRQTDRQTER